MLKTKATQKDIIQYLKSFYVEHKQIFESNEQTHYSIISKCYSDLSNLFEYNIKKIKNKYFDKYFDNYQNMSYPLGSTVFLEKNEIYIKDIIQYEIKKTYSTLISLFYHNTGLFNKYNYLIYLTDNRKEINKQLNNKEQIFFNKLLNYQLSFIHKENLLNENNYMNMILYLYNNFINDILSNDKYKDVFYIDTNFIFITNTREGNNLINSFLSMFFNNINKKHHNYVFFSKKKKYFIFDYEPIVKGYDRKNNFYANKQIKNTAYNFSKFNGNIKNFNEKNVDDFLECKIKAKTYELRKLKFNNLIK
jgi:hypothetical protein